MIQAKFFYYGKMTVLKIKYVPRVGDYVEIPTLSEDVRGQVSDVYWDYSRNTVDIHINTD